MKSRKYLENRGVFIIYQEGEFRAERMGKKKSMNFREGLEKNPKLFFFEKVLKCPKTCKKSIKIFDFFGGGFFFILPEGV